MRYTDKGVEGLKVAYVGGGSRGWAWGFMGLLAGCKDMCGDVYLYDIDYEAAKYNEIIGNKFKDADGVKSIWNYKATKDVCEAMTGADFVIISILPGTFEEMESDVHTPEKYGIYQSVGDTTGPGGIIRTMRTVPMYEEIAENIKKYCPNAWVINYTNPMTLCVKTLYRVFPEIKAYGCCHEVQGTQKFLALVAQEKLGLDKVKHTDIRVNPVGVNHFTWFTDMTYRNVDLMPYYKEYCLEHKDGVEKEGPIDDNWFNKFFESSECVKMELFNKFGCVAAAGDRHLAEFCEGKWYLESPEKVEAMKFGLTPVSWRKGDLQSKIEQRDRIVNNEEAVVITDSGEGTTDQMRALLGLGEIVVNVNIPNRGQIPNLPMGAVVETNAVICANKVTPVLAGEIPASIYPMVARACGQQELLSAAIAERDLEKIFMVFANDPLVTCGKEDARKLFDEMCENTKEYLKSYDL